MATTANDTTAPRYCLHCSEALQPGQTPAGEATLDCPACYHSVMLETAAESTLAAPRKPRQTLRRKMRAEALDVARELCLRQTSEDWSDKRHVAFKAALVVADAMADRNPAALRQLLEVA